MRTTKEDAIRAKAYGVALDAPDEKDALIAELRRSFQEVWEDREEWKGAFRLMGASREKWRRRWWVTFGALMLLVLASLCTVLGVWMGGSNG